MRTPLFRPGHWLARARQAAALLWLRIPLLLALCLLATTPAHAFDDLVLKRSFLVDATGQMGIDAVARSTAFKPVHGPLSRGYTPSVTWLRLEVAPSALGQLALLIQPTYLDDLRLYSPRHPGTGWAEQRSGDQVPLANKAVRTINPVFIVHSDAQEPTVHYLRLQTSSVSLVHVRAMGIEDMAGFNTLIHSVVSAYLGLIFILAVFAFICWRLTRDRLWGLDSLFQCVTLCFTFSIMGFGGRYLFGALPAAADLSVSILSVSQVAIGGAFFWQLFKAYGAPGWTSWVYRGSLLLFPVMLLLMAAGQVRTAVSVNSNLILLQTVAGLVIIWFVPIADPLQRWLMRGTYFGLLLYLLVFILPLLGLARPTEFHMYPALGANLFTALLLQAVLWRRTHLQLRERMQLRLRVAESNEKLRWETQRRAEAASFLSMLLHEIKNPLASIWVATQTLVSGRVTAPDVQASQLRSIQQSVKGIDAVLERCVDADRLEQGALSVQTAPHDMATLLADWVAAEPDASRVRLQLPDRLSARVDAPLLCMMFRNLLSNALRYSPDGSEVAVSLRAQDAAGDEGGEPVSGLLITVGNAVGRVGAPDPARVFEKYYRAPNAHRHTGTGLGLYWVHSVARLLGGGVAYRQEGEGPDQQVVFELWLPRESP